MGRALPAALALAAGGCVAVDSPKHYLCHRTDTAIDIDGRLDDPVWSTAPWTDDFIDIQGDHMPRPRFRTRAKLLWDDGYLYVAAALDEPHVWGTLEKHDEIVYHDNDFEVFIDPDGDTNEYYEIEVNALNTIFDLFLDRPYNKGGHADHGWDMAGLRTAIDVDGSLNEATDTDRGWSVELALPWSAMAPYAHRPAPPREGDVWRVNFSRVQWRHRVIDDRYEKVPDMPEDNWVWSAQGAINMHVPERWGSVEFAGSVRSP